MAAFIVVVAGMRAAESLLVPFLLSLFIAVIVTPLLSWLKSRGLPSAVAIILIMVLIVTFGAVIGAIVGSSISDFRGELPQYQERLLLFSDGLQQHLAAMGVQIEVSQLREVFNPSRALTMAGNTLASFGNLMTDSVLILLTVMFILSEEMNFAEKFRYAFDEGGKTMEALERFTKSINKYMALKTLISLATGFTAMIAMMIVGVDYPVLWGLLAFLLNFIPTLGSLLAAIPPVILALVQLGVGDAIVVAVIYMSINTVIGSIVEPRFMGQGLNLSALVVFLSLVFWGWVLGSVGMLLSVPLTMTVKIALESFEDTQWIGVMLGSGVPSGSNSKSQILELPK